LTNFGKYSNIKFHKNPSSGSRIVPCGRTDGRMGIKKPAVTSRNFGNVPNRRNVLGNKVVSTVPKRLRFHVTQHSGMPITKIPH